MEDSLYQKIMLDVGHKSIFRNADTIVNSGRVQQDYDYEIKTCTAKGLQDYYFVVFKRIEFNQFSLDGHRYVVLVYDKNGDAVHTPEIVNRCKKNDFFTQLVDVQ